MARQVAAIQPAEDAEMLVQKFKVRSTRHDTAEQRQKSHVVMDTKKTLQNNPKPDGEHSTRGLPI